MKRPNLLQVVYDALDALRSRGEEYELEALDIVEASIQHRRADARKRRSSAALSLTLAARWWPAKRTQGAETRADRRTRKAVRRGGE